MEALWLQYQNCQDALEKEGLWREMLPVLICNNYVSPTSFSGCSDFANTLATKFLSAIDEQCSVCEDEPENLVSFLSYGYGCQLLLALNSFSSQVSTCCTEICNLLLSIIPLIIQNQQTERCDGEVKIEMLLSKSATFSSRLFFKCISQQMCDLPSESQHSTSASSDEEVSNLVGSDSALDKDTLLAKIKSLQLDHQKLFFHLLSAFLGLLQNDVMVKELDSFVGYLERCFTYMLHKQTPSLAWYQYYGLSYVVFTLLNELSSCKDGILRVLQSPFYSNFYSISQSLVQKSSTQKTYLFLMADSLKHIVTCLSQSVHLTTNSTCSNSDVIRLLTKFTQSGYFDTLKIIINTLDSDAYADMQSGTVIKHCFQSLDTIFKLLVKMNKQLKGIKGFCNEATSKHQTQRNYNARHSRKAMSSDDELSLKGAKRLPDSDHSHDEEDSAENVSDFENFLFEGTSDSDADINKPKTGNKQRHNSEVSPTAKKDKCFVSKCLFTMSDGLVTTRNQQALKLLLIQTMSQIGVCKCIDLDTFLLPIVSSLPSCTEKVADKVLSLVCYLLSSNWENMNQKSGVTKHRSSSRVRTKSRTTSSSGGAGQDENTDVAVTDVPITSSPTFHFLSKFKTYLTSGMTPLKNLVLKHLKLMTRKMPLTMQRELFTTILLQNFRSLFPVGSMEKVSVPFSIAEETVVVKSYLDLMYLCIRNNNTLAILFHKLDGIEILKKLVKLKDEELSMKSVNILDFLCWLETYQEVPKSGVGGKPKVIDEKLQTSFKEISMSAVKAMFIVAHRLTNGFLEVAQYSLLHNYPCLLEVCKVLLDLFYRQENFESSIDFTVVLKCEKIFMLLVEWSTAVCEDSQTTSTDWMVLLEWFKVFLPLQLVGKDLKETTNHCFIMENLRLSILNKEGLFDNMDLCEQIFLALFDSCVAFPHKTKTVEIVEKDESTAELKSPVMDSINGGNDNDFDTTHNQFEERGYEADQDSDDSTDCAPSSHHTHLFVTEHKKNVSLTSKLNSHHSIPRIKLPWLLVSLLRCLSEEEKTTGSRNNKSTPLLRIVKICLKKIFEYQVLDPVNNQLLKDEELLSSLLDMYEFVFIETDNESLEIQDIISKMVVNLSAHSIKAYELKRFLTLFKVEGINKTCLSKILLQICQVHSSKDGPQYHLTFPASLNRDNNSLPQGKLLHRTQAFMIPKQEPAFRQSHMRSQSLSSMYEVRGTVLKPISYSNQPSSWESSAIQLPLASNFYWPDKEFSLCLWYLLEDNTCKIHHAGGGLESSACERHLKNRHPSNITLISQQSHDAYGCEELYHLCSFGGPNAMFEIWIGARTGYFQYRWITSCYGNSGDEQLMTFDQVGVQHHSEKNKWHQLAVSLVLPSEPHTAEIASFLDGVQIPSVQMKYPSKCIQSQVKLSLLIGHGVKNNLDVSKKQQSNHILKTGVHMVFQGKHSFMSKGGSNIAMRLQKEPLIDKIKAIYLYYLGPNSSTVSTEYQEYFSNQTASHMDSSLDWDSIVFKELSFCMNILSEKLISDKFPMELLESPMEVLSQLKIDLQGALMVVFNPRNNKEFVQLRPQLKTSGNIQHTFLNDVPSSDESYEGTTLPANLFCNLHVDVMETFKNAVHTCGGMSVLLYLHAMVAEDRYSEEAQACILRTIFSVQESCPYLLREMNDFAGYILVKRALQQSPCTLTASLMKALLESICDGDLFLPEDEDEGDFGTFVINQNTSAVVKNVCILQMLLKDWTLIRKADFDVQEILWQALETLVRQTHRHVKFNVVQFQRARVVENLLVGCQEVQQEKYFQLPPSICKLFIGVITNLLGQPVDLPVLKAVCSFLIAIHPTLDTLTLHSASNFYLIGKSTTGTSQQSNVKLRDTTSQMSRKKRGRRTASFNEADLNGRMMGMNLTSMSPQVIHSQEDVSSGSMIQSEVIIRRGSFQSLEEEFLDGHLQPPTVDGVGVGLDEPDSPISKSMRLLTPESTPKLKIKGHRRIQSDGSILPSRIRLSSSPPSAKSATRPPLVSAESQDYDIISDSELASSCEGHEEYLVVDGFIDQTLESFTPKANREHHLPSPDVLYHLRLGLMQLLRNTLKLLPDNMVTRVFGTILKVEHLLVLVNQTSDKLREVALENLILYLQRGGRDCLTNFNRFKGCHLLANQLHQHPITMKIVESCITLLVSRPISLSSGISKHLDLNEDNVCLMAVVPCLTVLEGSVQRPAIFGMMVNFLLKVFDWVENMPLFAFHHGLADIVCNIVCALANEESGGVMISWKKESFGHLLHLLDWLVDKACCTCQTLYFQMYKDLQLSLEHIDIKEREKKGQSSALLSKTCRFLKYYLIQSAFNVFKENDLYRVSSRIPGNKSDPHYMHYTSNVYNPTSSTTASSSSKPLTARSLIKKIRGSVQLLPQPTIATPSEVQERFQDILSEAVKLATLFNKGDQAAEVLMFGHKLKCIGCAHSEQKTISMDADREFCVDLLEWFCINLQIVLSSHPENTSWYALLKSLKEEIIAQASNLFINFVSPLRSKELRLHFVKQFMRYKDNKHMHQIFLLTHLLSKRREKFLACLNSILSIPQTQLTEDEINMLKKFKRNIGKVNVVKMNDQKLLTEMRETKHKRREDEMIKRRDNYKGIIERNNQLCRSIADNGLEVSKVIVEEQDRQRQRLLRVVRGKVSKDVEVRKTWRNVIHHVTQERALWYHEESYPCSWQLDPTEGPSRMRKRLQRCHLEIAPKFFMADAPAKKATSYKGLLSYLFADNSEGEQPCFYSFKTNDTIRFLYHCKRVTPATKNAGEVLIGETHMYFVGDEILTDNNVTQAFFGEKDVISISWRYEEIHEILKRRYSLQDNALEIFLTSGRTFLLAFENTKSRDEVYEQLNSRELPNLATATLDLATLTNKWKEGHITNFEYLTELNKKAGRSFNDLMQYPVLPFVLADYESDVLDLTNPSAFRNLVKPIACQDTGKEERYIETYEYLKADFEQRKYDDPENATPPYHYSSHYSNSGTVLHFLVRLPPFTSMFLKYQDNQFDIPDRTFHSMGTTWKLSSFISNTDVKELIPEFFFLQEFLLNGEIYDMGTRQNKERVDDVTLPSWARNDPRLFTLIHMQALESGLISSNIHHWIDLVFGVKQTGPLAVKATNVFHPATYFGVDVSLITDAIHRRALQTMIETYGQTPLQLFVNPHPKRFSKTAPSIMEIIPQTMESMILNLPKEKENSLKTEQVLLPESCKSPLDTVIGVQWGDYCGSKSHPTPIVQWVQTLSFPVKTIITDSNNLSVYLCQENVCVLTRGPLSNIQKPIGMLTWGNNDSLLQVHSSNSHVKTYFNPMRPDEVTCCEFVPSLDILFVGGSSGILNVWPVRFTLARPSLDVVGAKQNLLGHSDSITSICVCQPYSVAVTTSKDKTAILWDLNRLSYIRSICGHETAVECTAVNDSSGDIATACNLGSKGIIYMWTINAKPIGRLETKVRVNCLAFSALHDGIAINVLAAGLHNGSIQLWDTWTLNPVRTLMVNSTEPVTAMAFSAWNPLHFFTTNQRGNVYLWTTKDTVVPKPPNFVLVATRL